MPFTYSLRQRCLSSAVYSIFGRFRCVHSCLYFIYPVFPLANPLLLLSRVPCRMVFEMVVCRVIWPSQENYRRFTVDNKAVAFQQGNPLAVSHIRSFCARCKTCGGTSWSTSFEIFVCVYLFLLSESSSRIHYVAWIMRVFCSISWIWKLIPLLFQMMFIADMATAILVLISFVEVPSLLNVDQS